MHTRNYRLNVNGNSAIFSRMFVMDKELKNYLPLLEIAASVIHVSSTPAVLNAKLPGLVAARVDKRRR